MPTVTSTRKPFPFGRVVVPIITIGILIVLWRMNIKWATLPVILFVLFYLLALPKIIRARTARFNRRALLLLTSGQANALPGLVRRSILLQLFGPRGPLDAKLALAYVQSEAYREAIPCFESGIRTAPPTEQVALQTGLAKALFAVGDFARAEAEALSIIRNVTRLPELLVIIARSRIGLKKSDDETRRLLDEADTLSPSPDVSLMITLSRIELALSSGRKPPELPSQADAVSRLIRAWIHLVRGELRARRGDDEKARQSYAKAIEILPASFVSKAARERLQALTPETTASPTDEKGVDPAVRRKKRRRR